MSHKFDHHFLMDISDVKQYVCEKLECFNCIEDLEVCEIGDGNINYVFKITDIKTKKSLVLKQSDRLLRASKRPLDIKRSQREVEYLILQSEVVPNFIPHVHLYDEVMAVIVMEDISEYHNLRYDLMDQKIDPNIAHSITEFLVQTLAYTSDIIADRQDKKRLVRTFTNIEMCDISEDLVFTEPYNDYKGQNVYFKENESMIQKEIYQNIELIKEVSILRTQYLNQAQALLHGDLHSGSIFVKNSDIKVIDPEFAFYGPMGYDIGNVIAHLIISRVYNLHTVNQLEFDRVCATIIQQVFDQTSQRLNEVLHQKANVSLYQNKKFLEIYVKNIMSDSVGYAGTEILRRTIGDSKVKEIEFLRMQEMGANIEAKLIRLSISLIQKRRNIQSGTELESLYQTCIHNIRGELNGTSR